MLRQLTPRFLNHVRVKEIIFSTTSTPLGRITDEFDRALRSSFADPEFRRDISSSVLAGDHGFKVPPKVRDLICDSVRENLSSLGNADFLRVPAMLHAFPSLVLCTAAEDELFENFMVDFIRRCSGANPPTDEDIRQCLIGMAKLRLTHQCKLQPIVRLFQKLGNSPIGAFPIVRAAAAVLPRELLAHPEIRTACMSHVVKESGDVGNILRTLSRLPGAHTVVEDVMVSGRNPSTGEDSVSAVFGCILLAQEKGAHWFAHLTEKEKLSMMELICGEFLDRGSLPLSKTTALIAERVGSFDAKSFQWTPESFAGYLCITDALPRDWESTLHNLPGSTSFPAVVSSLLRLNVDPQTLCSCLENAPVDVAGLRPAHARVIGTHLRPAPTDVKDVVTGFFIKRSSDPLVLAHILANAPTNRLAEKLISVVPSKPGQYLAVPVLAKIERILTRNGTVYADPALLEGPLNTALRHVRKLVFRAVRMAEIVSS